MPWKAIGNKVFVEKNGEWVFDFQADSNKHAKDVAAARNINYNKEKEKKRKETK